MDCEFSTGAERNDVATLEQITDGRGRVASAQARPARTRQPRRAAAPRATSEQRAVLGKAARAAVPRSIHGAWEPARDRRDPVDLLEEQNGRGWPTWFPCAMGGCWCHRSRSSAGPPI
jgi:hypothetical protein